MARISSFNIFKDYNFIQEFYYFLLLKIPLAEKKEKVLEKRKEIFIF